MKEVVTNTSFMEFQLTGAWNFHQQECIVKIDVFIVGDQWNFMIQCQWNQIKLQSQKIF